MDWVVRMAEADDVAPLVRLMTVFYAEAGFPLDRQWAASAFAHLLSNPQWGHVWLAEASGQPVGHAVLSVRYTMEHGGLSGYIDDLFVEPSFRRRGVARSLLEALFNACRERGCRSVQVETGRENEGALGLYATFGFHPHQDGRLLLSGALPDARA